jgi:hypothetical protein
MYKFRARSILREFFEGDGTDRSGLTLFDRDLALHAALFAVVHRTVKLVGKLVGTDFEVRLEPGGVVRLAGAAYYGWVVELGVKG